MEKYYAFAPTCTVNEAAYSLGITEQEVKRMMKRGELDYHWRLDENGRTRYYIYQEEIHRLRMHDERFIGVRPGSRYVKVIKTETIIEIPDEWYDEDYARICNRAKRMYERQLMDDLY
jgi:hypothetical protein